MHETEYAYAVARIRANETKLLTRADIDQLIEAESYEAAVRLLADKGFAVPEKGESFDIAEKDLSGAWELIEECAPDAELLEALVIANDFTNLKAAVKCVFSDLDPAAYYIYPCVTDTAVMTEAIKNNDLELLPEYLRPCAEKAMTAVSKLSSGQLAETAIDKASLEARRSFAAKAGSPLLEGIADLLAVAANIKLALRCAKMNKSADFALDAACESSLDFEELLSHCSTPEKAAEYIAATDYGFLAESLGESFTAFEKQCDNEIVSRLENAKYATFGPDPLIAYYYAKQAAAQVVHLDSRHFPKAYRVEGSIPYKTESDDIIEAHPIWYKAAPQAGFELSWQNTGDPVSLTMTFDVLADENGDMFSLIFPNEG